MVFVIVSRAMNKIASALLQLDNVYEIKRDRAHFYAYIDTDESQHMVFRMLKGHISKTIGSLYVYELYGIYNGKIDLFAYLPEEKKATNKYYLLKDKDLSDEELNQFLSTLKAK